MTSEITASNSKGEIVPFSEGSFSSLGLTDLRRIRFKGRPRPNQSFSGNFVECFFEDVALENIDFARCDWKDCQIIGTRFVDCNLSSASLITNSFTRCRFVRCRFSDTGISNCTFRQCVFEQCDLSNIVMKANHVDSSIFESCKTSNKIIESSLLLNTRWTDMKLEIGLLLGNFGLRGADLHDCSLYKKTSAGEFSQLDWNYLAELEANSDLNPIERFRIAYFRTGVADGDAPAFEIALDPSSWARDAIIESSFGVLLSNFAQFLIALYNSNQLSMYGLLKLHTNNFKLLEWLSGEEHLLSLYQVAAGVHLTLTREIDSFAALLQAIFDAHRVTHLIRIDAEGPLDKEYFQTFLDELGIVGLVVRSVKPRNSPLDLLVSALNDNALLALIAVILASRTKLELLKLDDFRSARPKSTEVTDQTRPTGQAIVKFNSGFSERSPSLYQINVQTLLPRSFLLDLHLGISVGLLKKARSILLTVLQPGKSSRS